MKVYFNIGIFLVYLSVVTARFPSLSKLKNDIEARQNQAIVDPKLARTFLDNDFESGSANPWFDESPGNVNWRIEELSSPSEKNSTAPPPATGTKYLRATRNADLLSGLAILRSPIFTANPGDRISFDFWIRSKRPEGNNLELVWIVDRTEYLLAGLSQYSTVGNFEWRKQTADIPVNFPTDGYLIFYGYCGTNNEDAIAIDNIVVESEAYTTPAPGTNCIVLAATVGTFTSPNYPSNYPNNANICWLITGAYNVNLQFNAFSTEIGRDILKIYLGSTTSSELYAELSGSTKPSTITQNTESMLIVFTSDSANTEPGFSIQYQVTRATTTPRPETTTEFLCDINEYMSTTLMPFPTTCGGTFEGTSGTIVSPNYPYRYCNNLDCRYLIRVSSSYRVQLHFTDFYTEYQSDYVTVYDGGSTNSEILLVGSGSSLSGSYAYSSSNEMMIRFLSDDSGGYSGWRATYSAYY